MNTCSIKKIAWLLCLFFFCSFLSAQELIDNGSFETVDPQCFIDFPVNTNGSDYFVQGCVDPWLYAGGFFGPTLVDDLTNVIWQNRNVDPNIPDGNFCVFMHSWSSSSPPDYTPSALAYPELDVKERDIVDISFSVHSVENNRIRVVASKELTPNFIFQDPSNYTDVQVVYDEVVTNAEQWREVKIKDFVFCDDYNFLVIYPIHDSNDAIPGSALKGIIVDDFSLDRQNNNPIECSASFDILSQGGGCFFSFVNTSQNPGYQATYSWTFGDGGSSNAHSPYHSYTSSGTFTVCLEQELQVPGSLECGPCKSQVCQDLEVNCNPPNINVRFAPFPCPVAPPGEPGFGKKQEQESFLCRACLSDETIPPVDDPITNWLWTYPGGTATGSTVQFGLAPNVPVTVCLTVTLQSGVSKTVCEEIICNGFRSEISNDRANEVEGQGKTSPLVYPNPGKGLFNLRLPVQEAGAAPAEVNLFDQVGKLIYREKIVAQTSTLDLEDLPAGIYFIHVNTGEQSFTEKLIIQN